MGRELLQTYPVFYDAIAEAEEYLRQLGASYSLMGGCPFEGDEQCLTNMKD